MDPDQKRPATPSWERTAVGVIVPLFCVAVAIVGVLVGFIYTSRADYVCIESTPAFELCPETRVISWSAGLVVLAAIFAAGLVIDRVSKGWLATVDWVLLWLGFICVLYVGTIAVSISSVEQRMWDTSPRWWFTAAAVSGAAFAVGSIVWLVRRLGRDRPLNM